VQGGEAIEEAPRRFEDLRAVVFAPAPILSVVIEDDVPPEAEREIHLHAAGQGFWVARMASSLGARVWLCGAFGGETGIALEALIEAEGIEVLRTSTAVANAVRIRAHDPDDESEVAATEAPGLSRHEIDDLYSSTLTASMDADLVYLTGRASVVPAHLYTRLATEIRRGGRLLLADLPGDALAAALSGGVDALKVSVKELVEAGYARDDSADSIVRAIHSVREAGADTVLVSRGEQPALASAGDALFEIRPPRFANAHPPGTGDSMFAALGVALASGIELREALRLAGAAGALNATRRGLGTGGRREIDRLLPEVAVGESSRISHNAASG
jgi:1-phosphofructokinase